MKTFLLSVVSVWSLAAADVVMIANADHTGVVLSKKDVSDIYSGRMSKWPDGAKTVPIYIKGGSVHESFLSDYVGKNDAQFIATWKKLVFTGKASMPDGVGNEADVIAKVKATPGAIGYIAPGTAADGVAVITVK